MLIQADARSIPLVEGCVQCVVTSPPYWGLRDYGVAGQLGTQQTPEAYISDLADVFDEVRRVLRDDGTCWVNLGDSYQNAKGQAHGVDPKQPARRHGLRPQDVSIPGLKPKDLVGIPWMFAFEARRRGWYLRSDIVWAKPNPMCEPVDDRPTHAHEVVSAPAPNQGWQPIETAPTDGTRVLLFWRGLIALGRHIVPLGNYPAAYWHSDIGTAFPTHWMPLPAPPRADAREAPKEKAEDASRVDGVPGVGLGDLSRKTADGFSER